MRKRLTMVVALVLLVMGWAAPGAQARAHGQVRADDGAHVVAEKWVAPRELDLTVASPALHGQAMVRLLVPAGWSRTAHRSWPTLWLLHGAGGLYTDWTVGGDVVGAVGNAQVITVMPSGGPCGWYTNWPGGPGWETFHLTELRQILARGYRAGGRQAIAGLSMGGFGAMSYAARHPGMFRSVAAFSALLDSQLTPIPVAIVLGSEVTDCAGQPVTSPWPTYQEWTAHNPRALAANLRGTPLYVESGTGRDGPYDAGRPYSLFEHGIEAGAFASSLSFVHRMHTLGIPVTTYWGPGTHIFPYWRDDLKRAMPMLLRSLRA